MKSITFRLGEEHIEELEALVPLVQQLPAYSSVTINKTTVLRMCIDIGAMELRRQIEAAGIVKKRKR